jgi:hypothetical protein
MIREIRQLKLNQLYKGPTLDEDTIQKRTGKLYEEYNFSPSDSEES